MKGGIEEMMKGARDDGPPELFLERAWGSRAKEVGVGEFLQPGEGERYPEKGTKEQQCPSWCREGLGQASATRGPPVPHAKGVVHVVVSISRAYVRSG